MRAEPILFTLVAAYNELAEEENVAIRSSTVAIHLVGGMVEVKGRTQQ